MPGTGWTLTLLAPVRPVLEPARPAARLGALLLGGAGLAGMALALRRRGRLRRDLARDAARRQELEEQVSLRTAELRTANARLRAEAVERQRAEATLHGLRDELAQANRRPSSARSPPAWRMRSTSRWPPSAPSPTTR
ncbi:hypothetical protein [Teichococcus aestuarii]|uniref:hypothetical protein n=1 Tax=Teichococcus aestuarii TaxID=568898 RepID=UPI003615D714